MATAEEEEDTDRQKFLVELEFVQSLANPHYIGWLASEGYLRDEKFIRYLDYLQYWKSPQYTKFLVYPHCLRFLDLLQHAEVRTYLTNDRNYALLLADQQYYHWLYRRRHTLHEENNPENAANAPAASAVKPAA
mmetsp:Transcript_61880/g.127990  ORF Transcript_61880/g.127990 Transcript_61880/m.127990 type:complete len:134 (-) Transcript_61880:292-693(-)